MSDRPIKSTDISTERKVGMGELHVLHGAGSLRTLLGSCVGLTLHDQRNRIGGLAHIVLPLTNGQASSPGKYADTAIPELVRLIEEAGGRLRNLVAKLAGGANMFSNTNLNPVGDQNLATVEFLLKDAGIPVLGRHCGGKQGRRMAFCVETGKVTVEVVGNPPVEF
jgi:chemotaxis protein CheD